MFKRNIPTPAPTREQYDETASAHACYVIVPVAYGAAYLDKYYPGWAYRVDLKLFNMSYPDMNILSHIHGEGFEDSPEWRDWSIKSLTAHGFYVPDNEYYAGDSLTTAWRTLILARRKGI